MGLIDQTDSPLRPSADLHYASAPSHKQQIPYAEALRVLAILGVVFIHVSSVLVDGSRDPSSFAWWAALVYDCASRWAVPVLVMISGALLLDPSKEESIPAFFRKRADRILIPLAFWSTAYSLNNYFRHGWSLKLVLLKIFYGVPSVHLWYLYMILGLYLMTPILRRYVRHATESERRYFIGVAFALACSFTMYFHVNARVVNVAFLKFIPFIAYFVCGYHLSRIDTTNIRFKHLIAIAAASVAGMVVGTAALLKYTTGEYTWELFRGYFNPLVVASSIAIFLIFRKIDSLKAPGLERLYKLFSFIAPYTMGIYLVHIMAIIGLGKLGVIWGEWFHPIIGVPATSVATFGVSFAAVYLVAKIPYLRRTVM